MNERRTDESLAVGEFGPLNEETILAAIATIARQKLDWDGTLRRDTVLVESLNLDSVRQLTLIVELEDRFRICFDERDEAAIRTAGDLVDLIRRKRGGAAPDAR